MKNKRKTCEKTAYCSNKNGITLVILVVTIIILIILAGVAIRSIVGENGVLNQSTKASDQHKYKSEMELVQTQIEYISAGKNSGKIDLTETQKRVEKLDEVESAEIKDGKLYVTFKDGKTYNEIEGVDSTNLVDPIELIDPVEPADLVDPEEPVNPVDPIDPEDPDPIDPTIPLVPVINETYGFYEEAIYVWDMSVFGAENMYAVFYDNGIAGVINDGEAGFLIYEVKTNPTYEIMIQGEEGEDDTTGTQTIEGNVIELGDGQGNVYLMFLVVDNENMVPIFTSNKDDVIYGYTPITSMLIEPDFDLTVLELLPEE